MDAVNKRILLVRQLPITGCERVSEDSEIAKVKTLIDMMHM